MKKNWPLVIAVALIFLASVLLTVGVLVVASDPPQKTARIFAQPVGAAFLPPAI